MERRPFRRKRGDTRVGTIEATYDVDFGVRSDMKLSRLLQKARSNSLSDLLRDPRARNRISKSAQRGGERTMATNKVVFVAFAIEDERLRDFLKGQSLNTRSPFEYIDMSVKEAYDTDWKERVRTRIRRSDGVLAIVSANSLNSSGQKWEIACAKEEGKKVLGVWGYKDDRTAIAGLRTAVWTWEAIAAFIDGL